MPISFAPPKANPIAYSARSGEANNDDGRDQQAAISQRVRALHGPDQQDYPVGNGDRAESKTLKKAPHSFRPGC